MLKLIHAVIILMVLKFLTSCLGIKMFIFIFSIKGCPSYLTGRYSMSLDAIIKCFSRLQCLENTYERQKEVPGMHKMNEAVAMVQKGVKSRSAAVACQVPRTTLRRHLQKLL